MNVVPYARYRTDIHRTKTFLNFLFCFFFLLLIPFDERVEVFVGFVGGEVVGIGDLKPLAELIERDSARHNTCKTGV